MDLFKKILAGIGVVFVAFIGLVVALSWWFSEPRDWPRPQSYEQTPEQQAQAHKQRVQAAVNRAEMQLVAHIKSQMHDPDSFELVSDKSIDAGDHIAMVMVYRGRNGFNALRKESVGARFNLDGEITWIGQIE